MGKRQVPNSNNMVAYEPNGVKVLTLIASPEPIFSLVKESIEQIVKSTIDS